MTSRLQGPRFSSRRRFLQRTLSGVAGWALWHGWPSRHRALAQQGAPAGQMTWAMHITLAPTWFDPAETGALQTPYLCLRALHDALVKPMPDGPMAPCLATRWHESADGLTYDFELRHGVKFHNGDPFTAADVQFSFERYKGAGAAELKKQVQAIEIVHPHHIRFVLHEPWPDFLTFYATPATAAGWIVPKNYTEKIGNDAFKNQPVGLGPYRFVSYQPGIELVLDAYTDYWRKPPLVKRLVLKSVPEPATRLAMLKQQEADVTYAIYSTLGEEVQRDKTLKLEPTLAGIQGAQRDKKVKTLALMGSGAPGNAAPRVEAFMYSKGVQSFLKDPDIDQWFEQQSRERNRTKREELLHKIQQKVYDEAYFLPIW